MRSDLQLLEKVEIKHEEFDGDRAGDSQHVYAGNVVVSALHTSAGIQCRMCGSISR